MVGTIRTCFMSPTQKERRTNLSSTIFILLLSSKGIEPFTALTNSFTENHHYQSDHLPLIYIKIIYFFLTILLLFIMNINILHDIYINLIISNFISN
jgi:hypothetical protein